MQYLNSSDDGATSGQIDEKDHRKRPGSIDLVDDKVADQGYHQASPPEPVQEHHEEKQAGGTASIEAAWTPSPTPSRQVSAKEEKSHQQGLWTSAKKQLHIQVENSVSQQFADWCHTKFTHVVAVWRLLDADHNMTVGRNEFMQGLRTLGYPYSLDELWLNLDRDHTGSLCFMEFAPEHALDLARFKHWAVETFGSIQNTFKALDTDGNGRLSFEEFKAACSHQGLPERLKESIRMLFLLVDDPSDYSSRGTLTVDEIIFLDVWQCPVYLQEKADLPGRMMLQNALLERNGFNALAAWRLELDKDKSMRVNFQEFTTACTRLARQGVAAANPAHGVPAVYCAFDKDRSGWFSLEAFDKETHNALAAFTRFIKEQHGKVSDFVRSLEETTGSGIDMMMLRPGLRGSDIHSEDIVLIFDGLTMGAYGSSKKQGARRGSVDGRPRLYVQDVLFLDRWKPGDDSQANAAWESKALKRMGTWLKDHGHSSVAAS